MFDSQCSSLISLQASCHFFKNCLHATGLGPNSLYSSSCLL